MKLMLLAMSAFLASAAEPARVPVLAELFTSEGCNSCPPADSLLEKLDRLQPVAGARVIVLSEHVDYWNQLGWRDPFSAAQFSQRQQRYARLNGGEVYTPQLVVDGRQLVLGSDAAAIQKAVAHAAQSPKTPVKIVDAKREGGEASVALAIAPLEKGHADVWVAIADERDESSVKRGENAGRTLAHVAVVRTLSKAGTVSKTEGMEKKLRLPVAAAPARVIVFLTDGSDRVIGAEGTLLP
jgi:hypothetical protein